MGVCPSGCCWAVLALFLGCWQALRGRGSVSTLQSSVKSPACAGASAFHNGRLSVMCMFPRVRRREPWLRRPRLPHEIIPPVGVSLFPRVCGREILMNREYGQVVPPRAQARVLIATGKFPAICCSPVCAGARYLMILKYRCSPACSLPAGHFVARSAHVRSYVEETLSQHT